MKRITKVTYKASAQEIETIRRFWQLIDSIDSVDEDTYIDLQNRIEEDGLSIALSNWLDAMEEED